MNYVRRRPFLLAAGALLVAPIVAQAQRPKKPYRIGFLTVEPDEKLQQSLRELGYVEGRDVILENRDTEGRSDRIDDLALDLVRLKVDVIVASYPVAVLSAKRATATIPIVMMNTPDPVQLGLVASLARLGGNITGLTAKVVACSCGCFVRRSNPGRLGCEAGIRAALLSCNRRSTGRADSSLLLGEHQRGTSGYVHS